MVEIRVCANSKVGPLVKRVLKVVRANGKVLITAMGADAVNQAVKAYADARVYLLEDELDMDILPTFQEVLAENEQQTLTCMYFVLTLMKRD